jgi:hypothetical protein
VRAARPAARSRSTLAPTEGGWPSCPESSSGALPRHGAGGAGCGESEERREREELPLLLREIEKNQ